MAFKPYTRSQPARLHFVTARVVVHAETPHEVKAFHDKFFSVFIFGARFCCVCGFVKPIPVRVIETDKHKHGPAIRRVEEKLQKCENSYEMYNMIKMLKGTHRSLCDSFMSILCITLIVLQYTNWTGYLVFNFPLWTSFFGQETCKPATTTE